MRKDLNRTFPLDKCVTRQALYGINHINPFFHRMILSSKLINYQRLNDFFPGGIKQPGNSKEIAKRHTGGVYNNAAWLWLPLTKKRLLIYYNPSEAFRPASRISITTPSVENLIELESRTSTRFQGSDFKFTSIEYTIDFHCKTSTDVGNLFYVFRRNYFCPHAKKTYLLGGKFTGYSHEQDYSIDRETNAVFSLDFSAKNKGMPRKRIKFYERGADTDKLSHEQFWSHNKCDRVRYEATISTRLLRQQKLKHIKNFLTNPKFFEVLFPSVNAQCLFQFKQFIKRQYRNYSPPTCDQDYFHKDGETVSFECLTEELIHAKENGLDLSNSLENYPKLDFLVNQVRENVRDYQDKWIKTGKQRIKELSNIDTTVQVQKTEKELPDTEQVFLRLRDFYKKK